MIITQLCRRLATVKIRTGMAQSHVMAVVGAVHMALKPFIPGAIDALIPTDWRQVVRRY